MTEATMETRAKTPWHLWVVGAVGLLWNGFGGYDYYMSHAARDEYFRAGGLTQPVIDFFNAMPAWATAAWALGVWGSVLGTVLILARSKWAVHAFGLSLLGMLANQVHSRLLSNGGELMGTMGMIMSAVIVVGIVLFLWYSMSMTKRGVLR